MPGNKLKEPLSGASTFKGFPHHQPVPPQLILNSDLHNPIDSRLPTPADFYIFIFLTRLANANFGSSQFQQPRNETFCRRKTNL